ncbi:hypothetical protein PR001_g21918 [Phytophthora rubi]|uniref:RxLR effector protein n=1 Tax=Phytophthora rubi TaxID=129364 RepID=A0A6A3IZ40_9STRA|nr:hypothetical protein PR002_g22177 [Phytophthora rubi]KAE8988882.1 hypothetical protein PR001_g21918 [Phytophthora rubi]
MKLTAVAVAAVLATASVVAADSPALRALGDVPKTGTATGTGPVEATNAQPAAGAPKDKKEWGWELAAGAVREDVVVAGEVAGVVRVAAEAGDGNCVSCP